MSRKPNGNIQLILGCMFSGKSTELLRRIRRCTAAKEKCILYKHAKDTRYDDLGASTHDLTKHDAEPCATLMDKLPGALTYDVIGVDEGQFFPDIVEFSEQLAEAGKTVIIAALDGTFQRKPFGRILELIPLAEDVVKLKAVCMKCQGDASFSHRIGSETQVELIGGSESYIAVCRQCYKLN